MKRVGHIGSEPCLCALPNSSNPYAIVGGNSNNVSNGNAGVSYVNNDNGNANSNNGGRSAFEPWLDEPKIKYRSDMASPLGEIVNSKTRFSTERERT